MRRRHFFSDCGLLHLNAYFGMINLSLTYFCHASRLILCYCQVRKIAADFYDDLPCHTSWVRVIWDFIFRPDVGPFARIKRPDSVFDARPAGDRETIGDEDCKKD